MFVNRAPQELSSGVVSNKVNLFKNYRQDFEDLDLSKTYDMKILYFLKGIIKGTKLEVFCPIQKPYDVCSCTALMIQQ